jgi:cytidylate kinase
MYGICAGLFAIITLKGEKIMTVEGSRVKISITGDLGSGKSTVCRYLKERYGFNVYSIGAIQRTLAEKYNMTTYEFNRYMEKHPEIDGEIDAALTEIGKRDEDMILDSRMAWHFVPDSYKVYLAVETDTAARRILDDRRGAVETYSSFDDARRKLLERKASENLRYRTKYGVDCANLENFDLIVDTTFIRPQEAAEKIMEMYRQYKSE